MIFWGLKSENLKFKINLINKRKYEVWIIRFI